MSYVAGLSPFLFFRRLIDDAGKKVKVLWHANDSKLARRYQNKFKTKNQIRVIPFRSSSAQKPVTIATRILEVTKKVVHIPCKRVFFFL
jgi:hypothetical protein